MSSYHRTAYLTAVLSPTTQSPTDFDDYQDWDYPEEDSDEPMVEKSSGSNAAGRGAVFGDLSLIGGDLVGYLAIGITGLLCLASLFVLYLFFRTRRTAKGDQEQMIAKGKSWSRIFEKEPCQLTSSNPTSSMAPMGMFGYSMPVLPTSASRCNLAEDSLSVQNLSAGLTGFQELPAKVNFTRKHRNRMNREISFAIASAKSKIDLCEIHRGLSAEGVSIDSEDEELANNDYEVVVDIKTPL